VRVDETRQSLTQAVKVLKENKILRIIVDISNATIEASVPELFDFSRTETTSLPLGTRMAIVYSSKGWNPQDVQFSEDVAVNRGLEKRSFLTYYEAYEWVMKKRSQ
jgi:hypothetical protein